MIVGCPRSAAAISAENLALASRIWTDFTIDGSL
jgi:hypothetical protein